MGFDTKFGEEQVIGEEKTYKEELRLAALVKMSEDRFNKKFNVVCLEP